MTPRLTMAGLGMLLIFSSTMAAQEVRSGEFKSSVVELYTSEGCSSCPPADAFLRQLGETKEATHIVPLAFHVDYWDYIGWKDPYASEQYTARQRMVAKRNRQTTIYTPEFVVDGAEARGSHKITSQIQSTQGMPAQAGFTLTLSDIEAGKLMASVRLDKLAYTGSDTPEVYLAVYENDLSSNIRAGENRGRTLKHDYVVRFLSVPQVTTEGQQHRFELQLQPDWDLSALGVSAVIRLQGTGETLQALKTML